MNYSGNMPDWHQYNSTQPIGSEVPPVGQNANHSPIFGSNISPGRLNGPTYSPEGLNKSQNEANFNHRNFQQSPNTLNRPNVPPENSLMESAAQMSACHSSYGAPSSRNTMIEGNVALESRNVPSSSLNEAIGQRNHQISMNRPVAPHLNGATVNGSMGPMGQRNTPPSIQGPVPPSSRQGTGSYMPCKLPCCNPDANISYDSWEKFGSYPSNIPYRDSGYPVDSRRFGNEFENREQLGNGAYNMDPRRNYPDYKYRKDPIIPRTYTHPQGLIQNYPAIQNYNFPVDYQKYPAYPIKEYSRESSISNPQNPGILKYQEQSVIVQQKYFTKQIQYQNTVIPKNIVPTTIGSNITPRGQSPYFNPQLPRDFPRNYSEGGPLANRGIQAPNPIHAAYPKYQMYQQKIAVQRFSMENHLRELTQIPGYQSHPKYQEAVLRYRELLRLQQTVDYQSTVQDQPKVVTSQINEEIQPINLQFDQNGVLINSSFVSAGFSNLPSPINLQNSKSVQNSTHTEHVPLNLQHSEQLKTQSSIGDHTQNQDSPSVSQIELNVNKNEQHYCVEKNQLRLPKYENESLNMPNSDDSKTSSINQRNSKDFADKPELDVRQFLANWDESEDEDVANANLPDVVLSSSATGVVEYENTKAVTENPEESKNYLESGDCRGRDDCGMFENTQNEIKSASSTDNQMYQCGLQPSGESTKSVEQDVDISESGRKPVRTGTVIQPTSAKCGNEMTLEIIENLATSQAVHDDVELLCQETESSNNNASRKSTDEVKNDIITTKESSLIQEHTMTSMKEHNGAHNHEANTEMCSSIKEIIKNDDDSKSSSESDSSDDTKHESDSNDNSSESDDSNSMDTHSHSSFRKSPKTIKGTEIHVDAQELSAIRLPPRNNSEMLDTMNLQKQTSFASEESHNPDDISLPDLPTSEYTPISTALNTPIHSDSEESSEPVIDLTTPANPIEIIQNSPMLSFTHSPIKMEPYEHLDENDLTDKMSHDTLDFEFQASNSCDNDYEKLTDASSHTTEQHNITQNDDNTFDSDSIEKLSEKAEDVERNTCNLKTQNDFTDNIADQSQCAFNEPTVMTTAEGNTSVIADHQPWTSVTVSEDNHQISENNTKHQDAKSVVGKLESLSEAKDRLTIMSEVTRDHLRDDVAHISSVKNDHSTNEWQTKYEIENRKFESTDNMTALNLVKDENKMELDSVKMSARTTNSEDVLETSRNCLPNSIEGENFKQLTQSECNSSMKNEAIFRSTNHSDGYMSSSEEDEIYTETIDNQTSFTGSLNIPLIPGEDFEEPKMPVLPMEGNCLTKIIKNTSPITDLDVLGSDEEKLDKMDEIWMEVGDVETVNKVMDVNIDAYAECREGSSREKILSSGKKVRTLQKKEWKCLKNSVKPKNFSKLFAKVSNDSRERNLKNTGEHNSQHHESIRSETAKMKQQPIDRDLQSATISENDNTTAILQDKHHPDKVATIPRSTNDISCCEDGKQNQIMSSDNNATVMLKCQEKANHINDIATKLLENARLFEPELKKTELQRNGSSCSDNASEKRMKLLKEFRRAKNETILDTLGLQSIASEDRAEFNALSSSKITEQCKNIEVDDKIIINQKATAGVSDNVLQEPDSEMTNSRNILDYQIIQREDVNVQENASHTIFVNTTMPVEKIEPILCDGRASLEIENPSKGSNSSLNINDNITVKDSNNVNEYNNFDIKVVSPFREDINECAINLSKSSNDLDLLNTLSEKDCAINNSYNFHTSEHMKNEELTEIESRICESTTCTEIKNGSPILTKCSCPEDNGLYTEIVAQDDKTLELNYAEHQNTTDSVPKRISTSTRGNVAEECILKKDTELQTFQESTRPADYEELDKFQTSSANVEDSTSSCSHPEKKVEGIYENCKKSTDLFENNDVEMNTFKWKSTEPAKSNGLGDVNEKEDQKPTNKITDLDITRDSKNLQNYAGNTLTVNNKTSIELITSFADCKKDVLLSNTPQEKTSNESIENLSDDVSNISEEKMSVSVENCIEPKSASEQEKSRGQLSVTQQSLESEPQDDIDCSTNMQNTLQKSEMVTNIHAESNPIHINREIIGKLTIVNDSLAHMGSDKGTKTDSLQITNLEVFSEIDNNLNTVDATFEAFGLENSFNDFNNFDVAPNLSDTADTDQSNDWKYSKAYARFKDCERYKNPDNFTNPILTSLETLDNLNTVPVYTTKDGKITYSPNPKFTYRTLIMEAREREGYPTLRDPYCGNSRAPECSNFSRNQPSFRKRKNSNTYSCSRNYGKKNYSEFCEPREYGESSIKNLPEPWDRSRSTHNKYNHQSRDRNLHHFTPYNNDPGKKLTSEQTTQEKMPGRYKVREESVVFDKHNKKKNRTSDSMKCNTKKQYKQSREHSTSNSTCSGSKRHLENASDATLLGSEKIQTTDMNSKSLEKTIIIQKHVNITKNGDRINDFHGSGGFTSASNENEYVTEFTINMSPTKAELSISSDTLLVEKKYFDSKVQQSEASSAKTEDKPSNNQTPLEISKHEGSRGLTLRPGLFPSEWDDICENSSVQRPSSCEMRIPAECLPNKIKEVHNEKTKMNNLYDGIDNVCSSKTVRETEKTSDRTDLPEYQCMTPSNSLESPIGFTKFAGSDEIAEKLNIVNGEPTINNVETQNISCPVSIQSIETEEYAGEQKISELLEASDDYRFTAGLNKETENTREEGKFDKSVDRTDDQMKLKSADNCTSNVKDVDCENLLKGEIHVEVQNEIINLNQISEVDNNVAVLESNDQIMHSPGDMCDLQKSTALERRDSKVKSHKIKPENRNGTSVKSLQANNNSLSITMISEVESISKYQAQCENYVAYSPTNKSPVDMRAIPKLVIKKADSVNCKNVCLSSSSTTSYDIFADKILDKEEQASKVSMHPKIPKILIRNAKSHPSTPSIEEVTEENIFSVTTKEETKVPKVKIRFEEKRPKSPSVSCNENIPRTDATENKIPKMKIKLEDRLSKVIIQNINTEPCESNEAVQKTIPKMKIKKFKGALGQIVDTQILPVSIPKMLIYTELKSEEGTIPQTFPRKEISSSDKSTKSVTPNFIQEDQKPVTDSDIKKIPKLKIKRQNSGCSIELNPDTHSISAVQPELKKVRKSSKLSESSDKRQSNKLSGGSEHQEGSGSVQCPNAVQSGESINGKLTESLGGNIRLTPEEIPKVIIKRASPSAEFKCELSKVKRDAIIKNKRWQPEVKLQRSWVLDCMAKDLNLDKLRLKLATPGSMLKKSLPQKEPELVGNYGKNKNVNTNQSEKKLFRSKSTSELLPTHESCGILTRDDNNQMNETDATDLSRELIFPRRCKSDLGIRFSKYSKNSECKKKLKHKKSNSCTIQLMSKSTLNYSNDSGNSSSIQSIEEANAVVAKNQALEESQTNFKFNEIQSNDEAEYFIKTSERTQNVTQGEIELCVPKIDSSSRYNETVDLDLNLKMVYSSRNTRNNSEYGCERFGNDNEIKNSLTNDVEMDRMCEVNDSHSHYSVTKCKDKIEVSKDIFMVKNCNTDSVEKHTKSVRYHAMEIKNQMTERDKIVDYKDIHTASTENLPTNYTDKEKTRQTSSTSISSYDTSDHAKTVTDSNTEVSTEPLFLETPMLLEPNINIAENSDICSSDAINTANNLKTAINDKNNIQKLEINDNSHNNLRRAEENNAISQSLISHNDMVEQKNVSMFDRKVLITSTSGNGELIDPAAKNVQDLKIDINLNNSLANVNEGDGHFLKKYERCKDSQTIIDILSDSPSHSQGELEIQLCPDLIQETDMCLYHEDAIPTQFELELEIIDNVVPDPLEVPMPQNQLSKEFPLYFDHDMNESSQQSSRILSNSVDSVNFDNPKSERTLPDEHDSQICSISTYSNKQDSTLAVCSDEQNSTSNVYGKTTTGIHSNVPKSSGCSDSLIKEVLAAKETLRKYLGKNKYESRFKVKARPKTAAEKKQGSSFDLNTLSTSESDFSKLRNHSSSNFIPEANSSKQIDQDFSSRNNNDIICPTPTKTDFKINRNTSERKHSKGSKNNLSQKKYSSSSSSIQKYSNLMQADGYLIPNHSSIDIKDRVEFTKGETTISLKNSKHLIKNHSHSDSRKKMTELMNSKDTKCRSESSRHDVNSKYIGKSKNVLPNTAVQESSLQAFGQSEGKSVSDAAKHKYKSLRTSLDQNINSKTDKVKFKSYKIPKITKANNCEREISTEELHELQKRESRMPILERQVDLRGGMELLDLNSDRETSRSPPLITSQENALDYEATTQSSERQLLSNKEKEVMSRQRTTFLERELAETVPSYGKETTVADIVNDMAYHEKATIRHRRYCTLCEKWFPTVTRYRRHLSGYQHRHTELTQRRTIHALFTLFTGRPCPRLQPPGVVRIDCEPGELTPLQIAVQGVTKESNKMDGNVKEPSIEDK